MRRASFSKVRWREMLDWAAPRNTGQFGDVEAVLGQNSQQAEPCGVAKETKQ
jgi:hypothetical protein